MKKATVVRMELPRERRILAVSDIHGNLDFLRHLLDKVGLCGDDLLFIVGDVLEKGPESLATLRYLMDLSARYAVYPVCGNCDDLVLGFVDGREELDDGFFHHFLDVWGEHSTLTQMGREAGLRGAELRDLNVLRRAISGRFARELDYLRTWPTVIETQSLLFVHGGVPSLESMEALDAWGCMKNDDFLGQDVHLDKWCVVGHWPVTLYHPHIPSAKPIVDRTKKIVSIDGGCCLKLDGQLNALILPDALSDDFSWTAYDGLAAVTALEAQAPSPDSVNIRWGRNEVDVLERGGEFCRCRHRESGRVLDILTEYLYERGGTVRCEDATDYRLPVSPGDVLHVVRRTTRGLLAKKDGTTGWYAGQYKDT